MKIRTKFIIALILVIILPAIGTTLLTKTVFSQDIKIFNALDTYYDIFNHFSDSSIQFEQFLEDYKDSPESILSDDFIERAESQIDSRYLYIEIYQGGTLYQSTYDETLAFHSIVENWIYHYRPDHYPKSSYTIESTSFRTPNDQLIEVKLIVNGQRLRLSYQTFEGIFLFLYAGLNIVFLSILLSWISNPIKRSLRKLTLTTNEIGKGNLDLPLEYNENDDFEPLAKSIEKMRQSLKNSLEQQQILEIEKKEMIANISHDLRTPITSIRGYVQGLKDGVARDEKTKAEYFDTIASKTYMIESLVNDLSVISKYDQNGMHLNFQTVNLRYFLLDCVDELNKDVAAVGGNIILTFIIKDVTVMADPEKLMRVFRNIIENAIKYRSDKALEIIILVNQDDDGILINVSDNGIGIPASDLEKIFNRFYRSDKSRNLNIKGNGIGLSICKDIILAHGGKISASNNSEDGLTLSIRLNSRHQGLSKPQVKDEEMETHK